MNAITSEINSQTKRRIYHNRCFYSYPACILYSLGYVPEILYVSNSNQSGHGSLSYCLWLANIGSFLYQTITIQFLISNKTIEIPGKIQLTRSINIQGNNCKLDFKYNGDGIYIESNNCTINKLHIANSNTNGVTILASYTKIINCHIYRNNLDGIYISSGANFNIIGENSHNISSNPSNIIILNNNNGLTIDGGNNNIIQNNYIGVCEDGITACGNKSNGVYLINGAMNNIFGGIVHVNSNGVSNNPTGSGLSPVPPTFTNLIRGNVISGNFQNGVYIENSSDNNTFYFNFIGTCFEAKLPIPNTLDGMCINGVKNTNIIGCDLNTVAFAYYNVISANGKNGINIINSHNTLIHGSFVGINGYNNSILSNSENGIVVSGNSKNTTLGGKIPLGNVVSGNTKHGILVIDDSENFSTFNTFCGMFAFSDSAAPNGLDGLHMSTIYPNRIGYLEEDFDNTNTFSGNNENGIHLSGNCSNCVIEPIYCGINNIALAIPNKKNGVLLSGNANNNTIKGFEPSVQMVPTIAGNLENGIHITDNCYSNKIRGCFIGTNIANKILPNNLNGISLSGNCHDNIISNESYSSLPNVICANTLYGVYLSEQAVYNIVTDNNIGVSWDDTSYIPNGVGNIGGVFSNTNVTSPNKTTI